MMKTSAILTFTALTLTHIVCAHDNYNIRSPVVSETTSNRMAQGYREIQTETLSRLVHSASPNLMIVDSRGTDSDDGKRIPGAKTIPYNASIENITANLPDKNATVIIYCANAQCPSSRLLAERLLHMGYKNIWRYSAGIQEWEAKGLKVEQGKPASTAESMSPKSA